MSQPPRTVEETADTTGPVAIAVPGAVLIFSAGHPACRTLPLTGDQRILGRDDCDGLPVADDRLSREHAAISWRVDHFVVRDLDSRNGSFLAGERLRGQAEPVRGQVLRLGHTLYLLVADLHPFRALEPALVGADGVVAGPAMAAVLAAARGAAQDGDTVLFTGASGTGKEVAARAFHIAGGGGPLIAVNCAAIPEGVAERLLFGATKGAYSGLDQDVAGYLVAADHGTLFLDEVGELGAPVQAKLLRVLETREVTPLGAARPRKVQVRICAATNRDLRAELTRGGFREDLYFRLARPQVRLPPLRERLEEIPWLAAAAVASSAPELRLHAKLVALLCERAWPGNVRELETAVRGAALRARAAGEASVRAGDLDELAGVVAGSTAPATPSAKARPAVDPAGIDADQIRAAMTAAGGNLSAAARALGLHRNQLYRLLEKYGIES